MNESIASPCVRICCLNDEDICMGCYRTIEEIKCWSDCSDLQKRQIIEQAACRRFNTKQK